MIYTIEKRKARDGGSLTSFYVIRQYTGRSSRGWLLNGETIEMVKTLKEAKAYCESNGIEYERV